MRAAAADWVRSKRSKLARMPGSWIWIAKPQVPVSAVEPAGAGAAAARANRITAKARNRGICMMTSSGSRVWLWLMVSRGEAAVGSTEGIDFPRAGHWPQERAIQPARSWRASSMAGYRRVGKRVGISATCAPPPASLAARTGAGLLPLLGRYRCSDRCGLERRAVARHCVGGRAGVSRETVAPDGRKAARLKNFHCSPPVARPTLRPRQLRAVVPATLSRRVLPPLVTAPWSLYVEF